MGNPGFTAAPFGWDRYAEILGAGCLLGHNFIGEEGYPRFCYSSCRLALFSVGGFDYGI